MRAPTPSGSEAVARGEQALRRIELLRTTTACWPTLAGWSPPSSGRWTRSTWLALDTWGRRRSRSSHTTIGWLEPHGRTAGPSPHRLSHGSRQLSHNAPRGALFNLFGSRSRRVSQGPFVRLRTAPFVLRAAAGPCCSNALLVIASRATRSCGSPTLTPASTAPYLCAAAYDEQACTVPLLARRSTARHTLLAPDQSLARVSRWRVGSSTRSIRSRSGWYASCGTSAPQKRCRVWLKPPLAKARTFAGRTANTSVVPTS